MFKTKGIMSDIIQQWYYGKLIKPDLDGEGGQGIQRFKNVIYEKNFGRSESYTLLMWIL